MVVNNNEVQDDTRLPQDGLKRAGKILLFISCRRNHSDFRGSMAAGERNGMPTNSSGSDHGSDASSERDKSHGRTENQKD